MSFIKGNSDAYQIKIKNMVCNRCISTVEETLTSLGAEELKVELGVATYANKLEASAVKKVLYEQGFELIEASEDVLVEEMKLFMQSLLAVLPLQMKGKLSALLGTHFTSNYERLSKLFSQHEDITVERYFLLLKIEKAKELIQYGGVNFTQIAQQLDYASINHLSKQFKVYVGLSLTDYKQQKSSQRKPIDKIV
jgi:AraC-like DNA-binding protein/copper chaperone CopZ